MGEDRRAALLVSKLPIPSWEGSGVGFPISLYPFLDLLDDTPAIVLHIIVPESQKSDPQQLESLLPHFIPVLLAVMAGTIDFDRQLQILTEKVDNIPIYWPLAVKIQTTDATPFQFLPKDHFCLRHIPAQISCVFFKFCIIWYDFSPHGNPPLAPPRRGYRRCAPLHKTSDLEYRNNPHPRELPIDYKYIIKDPLLGGVRGGFPRQEESPPGRGQGWVTHPESSNTHPH